MSPVGGEFAPHPSCQSSLASTTMHAFGEAAKVFGRTVYKLPYLMLMYSFEYPSIAAEAISGVVGSAVGGLVGTAAIVARKCMGVRAQRFFGLEQSRSLWDYSVQGFYNGARLGEIPGKFIGGCFAFSACAITFCGSEIALPAVLGISGVLATIPAIGSFGCVMRHGENLTGSNPENLIEHERIEFQHLHNFLQGRE